MKRLFPIKMNNYERIDTYRLLNTYEDWHLNGPFNIMFKKYAAARKASTTNNMIITKYVNYILGKGLADLNGYDVNKIFSLDDQYMFINDIKESANAPLQIIYNFKGEISAIYHVPVRCIGPNKEEDMLDEVSGYWYCYDWSQQTIYPPRFIPAFGKGGMVLDNGMEIKQEEIFYFKNLDDNPVFAEADWLSCIQYCFTQEEISNFMLKHTKNSFSAGIAVNFNDGDSYSDDQIDDLVFDIRAQLTGSDGDPFLISINKNGENAMTFATIDQPDAYQKYSFVSDLAKTSIMEAHSVTNPALFGVIAPSGFTSQAEDKAESKKDLFESIILPYRDRICLALTKIFEINSPGIKLKFLDQQVEDKTVIDENTGQVNTEEKNTDL